MNHRPQMQQLAKLLSYILEKRPDEFGLIPDRQGFVNIKELLKALAETGEWSYIRRSHINELILSQVDAPVELSGNLIRGKSRQQLPIPALCENPPKTLYTGIRKKAYPVVLEKGIRKSGDGRIICTPDREFAERIGKRKDNSPVILTVHTAKAGEQGVSFELMGESLYLADFIPPQSFTGPPLPRVTEKEKQSEKGKEEKEKEKTDAHKRRAGGGSYNVAAEDIDPLRVGEPKSKKGKGKKKDPSWKKEQRKNRRR
ncbi:MAG: RNA 2'-phosphotransferase [Desulfosalsimonas sp.]